MKLIRRSAGFTLIELLVVIGLIAILALAIIPNYVGFDVDARIVTTKSNLGMLRNRISLYRAKEGNYPESLGDLLKKTYLDAGIPKPYLAKLPSELVLKKSGISDFRDQKSDEEFTNTGGWLYLKDKAEVVVNYKKPLEKSWEDYAGQVPSEW